MTRALPLLLAACAHWPAGALPLDVPASRAVALTREAYDESEMPPRARRCRDRELRIVRLPLAEAEAACFPGAPPGTYRAAACLAFGGPRAATVYVSDDHPAELAAVIHEALHEAKSCGAPGGPDPYHRTPGLWGRGGLEGRVQREAVR